MVYLGVDVGGSKTHALVSDHNGQVLGFGLGPGGNPETVGYPGLTAAIQIALQHALENTSIGLEEIQAAGFGIAGYDWPHQYEPILEAVQRLGLTAKLIIENDAVPPIWAGTSKGWGIAACVGTGNNVRGVDKQGRIGRITGNSSVYGEYGGASEIMQTVLQRLSWMWSKRIPQTMLAELLVNDCGARDLGDLLEGIIAGDYRLTAKQAPLVVKAAQEGDQVAQEILTWNAQELGESVLAVARQLDLMEQEFEVVMAGRIFEESTIYQEMFKSQVHNMTPKVTFQLLTTPPVVGAVLMAMQAQGVDFQVAKNSLIKHKFDLQS